MNKESAERNFHLTKGKKEKSVKRATAKNVPAQGTAWFPCFVSPALSPD
jgi:hypothetical protein